MSVNFCGTLLLLIFSMPLLVASKTNITYSYCPEDNQLIKRLHASKHAKLFLYGCEGNPYVQLANTTMESDFFKLQKSNEYLFAIYTLKEVSIIISNVKKTNDTHQAVNNTLFSFNITLGLNKNSYATLSAHSGSTFYGNDSQSEVPKLPTIPHYVNVSITNEFISVYEARMNRSEPFLKVNFNSTAGDQTYSVKFRHSDAIYAHYDCCEACTPWIHTRLSGCSKYTAITASDVTETTHSLIENHSHSQVDKILFNQTFLINHDGSRNFAAKIIFSEKDTRGGNRYEIGLSDTPTILHRFNLTRNYTEPPKDKVTVKGAYTTPFIVNIMIAENGTVTLTHPFEEVPFLEYHANLAKNLTPVAVKYMTMVKVHEDFVRYDFYYDCTDLLTMSKKHKLVMPDATLGKDSYPVIFEYISKQFKAVKYDALHVFNDSYQIYEKSNRIINADNNEYEEQASVDASNSAENLDKTSENPSKWKKFVEKGLVGAGSFIVVGILKLLFSLDCVKNLMKEAELDDDQAKNLRMNVSNVVNKNIASQLGFDDEE